MKKLLNKIKWLWISFWGKKYRIIPTGKIRKNEVLYYKHRIYISDKQEEDK